MPARVHLSRRLAAGAVLLLLAGVLLLAAGGLGPLQRRLPGSEHFDLAVAPLLAQARQSVRAGEWPLWHPRAGAGYPLLASPDGQLLHPLTLPLYPLPAVAWLPAAVLLRVATGLVLAWLLLHRHGVPPRRAVLAAAVHGAAVAALATGPTGTFAAVAPGLLLAATELVRAPHRRRSAAAVLAALAAVLLTAEPVPAALALAVTVAFLLAACRPLSPRQRRRRLGRFAGLGAAALLACAPVVVLAASWMPLTHAWARFAEERRERLLADPLDLERMGMTTRTGAAVGDLGEPWSAAAVVSALAAAAALTVAVLAWRRRRQLPHVPFFTVLVGAALLAELRPPLAASLLDFLLLPPAHSPWEAPAVPWLAVALAWLSAAALGGTEGPAAKPPAGHASARPVVDLPAAAMLAGAATAFSLLAAAAAPVTPPADRELVARLQALQADRGYSRIAAAGPLLPPEQAARFGLADARGRGERLPAPYAQTVAPLLAERQGPGSGSGLFREVAHPLYDLLSVRWLLTPAATPGPPPGRLEARLGGADLWERDSALPLLFLPREVETVVPPEGWLAWVWHHRDFRATSLAQPPRRDPARTAPLAVASPRLEMLRITPTRLDAETELPSAGLVASSVYHDGGWRALVDGAVVETVRANGPFAGIWIAGGRHRLTLLYRPPLLLPAAAASAVGLALAALLLPPPRRLDRRLAAAAEPVSRGAGAGGGP